MPTVTVISTAFAPLAQIVGAGIGQVSLPIVAVPHPVGDRDETVVRQRGEQIAAECVRVLTTEVDVLEHEFAAKTYPLPQAVMPR
ncbi:MAG TPA: hypothetical protein VLN59_13820 [Burkholderiales bacterium]|nr:hypothetical protein [Burkholderiales bacterium]